MDYDYYRQPPRHREPDAGGLPFDTEPMLVCIESRQLLLECIFMYIIGNSKSLGVSI